MKVSKFRNVYNISGEQVNLLDELEDIRAGKYKNIIEKCRFYTSNRDYSSYKELKINLPIVTFSGTFVHGRKAENLYNYNKILILDVDHLNPEDLLHQRKILEQDKYIFATWLSPSGEGLKALIKIDATPEEHALAFESLKLYFSSKYNIELDKTGCDITRPCFVSWDENLYQNSNADVYKEKAERVVQNKIERKSVPPKSDSLNKSAWATEGLNEKNNRRILRKIIRYLERRDISITHTFPEWFRVAIAISNSFSYDIGEPYFLRICELDKERHNEQESLNILRYCYNNRRLDSSSAISFGTILFYAKSKGFEIRK